MKKIALLLVFVLVFSFATAYADIIVPENEVVEQPSAEVAVATENADAESDATLIAPVADETSGEEATVVVESGEVTPVAAPDAQPVEAEKTSNPVGAIVAIVVVIVMVLLVAFTSKK